MVSPCQRQRSEAIPEAVRTELFRTLCGKLAADRRPRTGQPSTISRADLIAARTSISKAADAGRSVPVLRYAGGWIVRYARGPALGIASIHFLGSMRRAGNDLYFLACFLFLSTTGADGWPAKNALRCAAPISM
jgi:hypothetical protein